MDTRYGTIGGEICQNCNRRYKLCWKAPDEMWEKVAGGKNGLLCIPCFDALAAANGIALTWDCGLHPIYSSDDVNKDRVIDRLLFTVESLLEALDAPFPDSCDCGGAETCAICNAYRMLRQVPGVSEDRCECGGEWKTDGQHQNEFCSKCFKPR